jgi:hypothetical protein
VSCPQTCSSAHPVRPILFPSLSSPKGDDSDVTQFLQSGGQYQNCRLIVIDKQWDYPGKYVGGTAPNFAVTEVSQLRSFHFYLWNISLTGLWWQEFVKSVPHLTFLNVSVRIQSVDELYFFVRSLICDWPEIYLLHHVQCAQLPTILAPLALEYLSIRLYRSDFPIG